MQLQPASRRLELGGRQFLERVRLGWATLRLAGSRFLLIDAFEWAGAFAFNAFFSLFPLMILLVTIASVFVDRGAAGQAVISYLQGYFPLDAAMKARIFEVIAGVINGRTSASGIALLALVWTTLQCFSTLINVTNAAWGYEAHRWWRLPLKSLGLLALTTLAILGGIALPTLAGLAEKRFFSPSVFGSWTYGLLVSAVPLAVVFGSLLLFYRLAPQRREPKRRLWVAALCATGLLLVAERLFAVYLARFATLNALYGAFGGIMALLLWVYLSGGIFIFGACLCAAEAELAVAPAKKGRGRGPKARPGTSPWPRAASPGRADARSRG
ncbi:MAG: YihY/virulence factor BrkB family protein [Archangium sp.]|nr:YihY/virulence factor BrkB family protein [Archangium sp.]